MVIAVAAVITGLCIFINISECEQDRPKMKTCDRAVYSSTVLRNLLISSSNSTGQGHSIIQVRHGFDGRSV